MCCFASEEGIPLIPVAFQVKVIFAFGLVSHFRPESSAVFTGIGIQS